MKIYILNLVLFLIVNSFDGSLSVENNLCEKNGKTRPTFTEIFGQRWENEKNDSNSQNAIDSDQNNYQMDNQHKSEIVHKFHAIKEGIKKKGKNSPKIWIKIELKIAKKLGICRTKIYKWKKEYGLSRKIKINKKNYYKKKKRKFIERINEFKRTYKNGKQKQFMKELDIGKTTFRKWKTEFGIEMNKSGNAHSNEEKMNIYYKMKKGNPSLSDKEIAEFLEISPPTLSKWKKQKLS